MNAKLKIVGVLLLAALAAYPARCADDLVGREARLLAKVKAGTTSEIFGLARVREQKGDFKNALATWSLIEKWRAAGKLPAQGVQSQMLNAPLIAFWKQRLRRKINLAAKPVRIDAALRRRIAHAAMVFGDQSPVDQLDIGVQADLDGDGIDEYFFLGKNGPLGNRKEGATGIASFDGSKYVVAWQTKKRIPVMVWVADEDGDGWKEITLGYTPDSDDVAFLHFNGKDAVITSLR